MDLKYDIVIIGAGIAGCISAMYLYQNLKIVVINKDLKTNEKIYETLVASSKRFFSELKIEDVLNNFSEISGTQSYWGSETAYFTDALKNPEGASILVEKNEFTQRLRQKLVEKKIEKITDTILQISKENDGWEIKLKNKTIKTDFIIDASGRTNLIKKQLQISKENMDKLVGLHAILPEKLNLDYSIIYPDNSGWFYFLPISEYKTYVSYFTDSDLWNKKDLISSKLIFQKLQQINNQNKISFTSDFKNIEFLKIKASHTSVLDKVVGTNWVAVGDAALTFDPLSSSGMYNALIMSKFISEALKNLKQAKYSNSEFGEQVYQFYKRIWDHYTKDYELFYGSEMRFPNAEFWKRRSFNTPVTI